MCTRGHHGCASGGTMCVGASRVCFRGHAQCVWGPHGCASGGTMCVGAPWVCFRAQNVCAVTCTLITSPSPCYPHHLTITMLPSSPHYHHATLITSPYHATFITSPSPCSCYRVAQKLIYPKLRWDLFTKGTFNIPKSILDLIYTQLLLWYG